MIPKGVNRRFFKCKPATTTFAYTAMFSILKHLDGSAQYSLGFWYDDGVRHLVAYRVEQEEMDQIKEEFAQSVLDCNGIDASLRALPALFEN